MALTGTPHCKRTQLGAPPSRRRLSGRSAFGTGTISWHRALWLVFGDWPPRENHSLPCRKIISSAPWEPIHITFFTTKQVEKGTGLGHSISRGIVEAHGGHLRWMLGPGTRASWSLCQNPWLHNGKWRCGPVTIRICAHIPDRLHKHDSRKLGLIRNSKARRPCTNSRSFRCPPR